MANMGAFSYDGTSHHKCVTLQGNAQEYAVTHNPKTKFKGAQTSKSGIIQKSVEAPEECEVTNATSFNMYGGSAAVNVLDLYPGKRDRVKDVLLLDCGDMRNALLTASNFPLNATDKLNVHVSNKCPTIMARNLLITHTMLDLDFNPNNKQDLQYLWDVWYGFQWKDYNKHRFMKAVKQLIVLDWSKTLNIKIADSKMIASVNKIFSCWLATANASKKSNFEFYFTEKRTNFMSASARTQLKMQGASKSALRHLKDNCIEALTELILANMPFGNEMPNMPLEEVKGFIMFGDCCSPIAFNQSEHTLHNPTLLTLQKKQWQVCFTSTPYDAYLPVSWSSPENQNNRTVSDMVYNHCKLQFKERLSELRLRLQSIEFHFHPYDYTELEGVRELKNKFQIVYSFDLAERAGLANLIPATVGCLAEADPYAVLVTPSKKPVNVESSLFCPPSMFPSLYGVRLVDQLQLGSSVCLRLHDSVHVRPITFKWMKVPAYSRNIVMGISQDLKNAIGQLKEFCFGNKPGRPSGGEKTFSPILRSLKDRFNWIDGAIKSLTGSADFPGSFQAVSTISQPSLQDGDLRILNCYDSTDCCEFVIGIQNINVQESSDVLVSINNKHRITLAVGNAVTLTFQVSWPVMPDNIKLTLQPKEAEDSLFANLILKKNFGVAWPGDFIVHSKLDYDVLEPWMDLDVNSLTKHMEAQFNCAYLSADKSLGGIPDDLKTPLNKLREIVRSIFYSAAFNLFPFFVVCVPGRVDPVLHLRVVHPPRCSVNRSPLLLMSVFDHLTAEELKVKCPLTFDDLQVEFNSVFHRDESIKVCTIRLATLKEVDLLRSLLRLNAKQISVTISKFQAMLKEQSPFMASFISPLYAEDIQDCCSHDIQQGGGNSSGSSALRTTCSTCFIKNVTLKLCGRCQSTAYCSASCQKVHWPTHKSNCSAANKLVN